MSTIALVLLCGLGCLSAAAAALLLTGRKQPTVAFGGALAFLSVLLVLVCAGVTVARYTGRADGASERMLEQMIQQELR